MVVFCVGCVVDVVWWCIILLNYILYWCSCDVVLYCYLLLINIAKAALTAARSAATSIYVVPLLQAELDEMSGILHCEEGDTVTAYSYFLEAYEAFDSGKDVRALTVLKYMALCKTLNITADTAGSKLTGAAAVAAASGHSSVAAAHEVAHLFTGKYGLKYGGADMDAMQAVAKAAEHRSLQEFKDAVC